MWRSLVGLTAVLFLAAACAGTQQSTEAGGQSGVGGNGEASQQGGEQTAQNTDNGQGGEAAPTEEVQSEDMASGGDDGQQGNQDGGQEMAGAQDKQAEPGTRLDFVQSVQDRVFFGFDQSSLTAAAQRTLRNQAEWLQEYPRVQITIQGHTDARGTTEYNLALGQRRASAVRDYLVAQGVAPERIEMVSYGEERPAVEGSNEWAWAQNRRAVTVVEGPVEGS